RQSTGEDLPGSQAGMGGRPTAGPGSADREKRLLLGARGADAHPGGDGARDRGEGPGGGTRLALGHRRDADVPALANGHVQRHDAEIIEAVGLAEALPAAAPEDLRDLAAMRADERGHVL